jgi:Carboxypeptidase regulatory-like domain/TonB-dependent Receptor Plug Domain/TonB dependent receptor
MPFRRELNFIFIFLIFAAFACSFLIAVPARAQVVGATLSGTITDPSGSVVPNAQVSVRNTATGVTRGVAADTAGLYVIPNLLPGTYEVSVTAPGFSTSKESNLVLGVGAEQQLNFSLKVGETTQTVQVTEAVPLVQTTSSTLTSEVESTTVRELPLNGRDWASLAALSPGVTGLNGEVQLPFESGALRGNRGFGSQLTISGGRPTQNNYRLDGLSISDYTNGSGSVMGATLGVDAIQEFSVITGNYSAEYGRTSGGVINAISKSGTNSFHGDAYEFWRNDALDANDFFSNRAGAPLPTLRRNQFGAAAGGPIIKDRTFIFGDYEGIRLLEGAASGSNTVPSENARLGILVGGTPAGKPAGTPCVNPGVPGTGHYLSPLASVCVDDNAAKYLALFPHANGPVTGDTANFVFAPTRQVTENFVTVRGDHRFSDKDSLFATYNFDNSPFTTPDGFDTTSILSGVRRHVAALEWTHTLSPALLNTARLGYNRNFTTNNLTTGAINSAYGDPSLSMLPGYDAPALLVSGGGSRTSAGLPGGFTYFVWNSLQFYDDAFWTRGNHSLKFGFAVENMRYNPLTLYLPNGLLRIQPGGGRSGLENFLENRPTSLEAGLPSKVSPRGYRETLFGGYVQDDWHWRHNLTLNIGLRYEMSTVVSEQYGKLTSLRNPADPLPYCGTTNIALTSVFGQQGCAGVQPITSNPTTRNFEPRIGFSWDPRGNGKMAVRGGFAIFDVLPLPGYYFSQAWEPFFLSTKVADSVATPLAGTMGIPPNSPGSAFSNFGPTANPACKSPLGVCTLTASYTEPNPKRNYVEQWNINFQRQITPNLTATLGYVGSHGVHQLIRGDDFDMVIPTLSSAGWLWPLSPTGGLATPQMRINPNFGLIRGLSWGTDSTYEALQVNVQKRMSHGFQFGGSYTYGKSKDSDSGTILGDAFSNSITTWFWFAPSISRALSDYNITHTAAINAIWDIPGPKSLHGPAGVLVNGWEVGSILKLNSGFPTTPLISGDPMGVQNSGSDTFGIPNRVPGCDPVNHNWKSDPKLAYINLSCFQVPMATPAIATQCVPFTKVPGSCSNLLGNAGRNSITGPGLGNLDLSLYKNFALRKISESASVQFRAEFFNILNRANFGAPLAFQGGKSAQILDGTTGLPLSGAGDLANPLVTKPREGQLALKLIW